VLFEWNHFKYLLNIRDKEAIHPKNMSINYSYKKLNKDLNMYKTGISGMLINLHKIYRIVIPCFIIRRGFYPEIEIKYKY
jgi:hypothetical protein